MTTLGVPTNRLSFAAAVAEYLEQQGHDLARLARDAGVSRAKICSVTDGVVQDPDARLIEAVASVLRVPAHEFIEFRLAVVVESLRQDPASARRLFLESRSPIEREHLVDAKFSDALLGPTIWSLLAEEEMTQGELAESIGLPQWALSRIMNRHDPASPELLETVAQALDVAPELFAEYRLALIADWLHDRPGKVDELYERDSWRESADD